MRPATTFSRAPSVAHWRNRRVDTAAPQARPPGMAGPAAKVGSRRANEEAIHRAVVDLLTRAARSGVAWTHMPAGEARGPGIGGKLKGMGVKPGWPDLLLVKDGRLYGLELKTPTGRVGPAQRAAHADLEAAGATISVAYGLDAAIAVLREWEMIKVL